MENKVKLVLDKMPIGCSECPLSICSCTGWLSCKILKYNHIDTEGDRFDYLHKRFAECPLKADC